MTQHRRTTTPNNWFHVCAMTAEQVAAQNEDARFEAPGEDVFDMSRETALQFLAQFPNAHVFLAFEVSEDETDKP